LFVIGGSFQPGTVRQGIAEISAVLARIKGEGIKEADLRKARVMVETAFTYDRETVEGEAGKLGWFETVMGDATKEQAYLEGIARVGAAKIQEVAAKYLRPENLALCLLIPKAAGEEVEAHALPSWVGGITAISPSDNEAKGIRKAVLENGITVLFKEDHSVPVAGIAAVFLGGVRFEKEKEAGITRFLAEMMTKGPGGRFPRSNAGGLFRAQQLWGAGQGFEQGLSSVGAAAGRGGCHAGIPCS
jgi:zinc protease